MQTPTTILSVKGQAEFVVLPYTEYIRLKNMACAAPSNMAGIITDKAGKDPASKFSLRQSRDAPSYTPSIDPLLTVDLHYSNERDKLGPTEIPHAIVQLIHRQSWSIVRAWREYLGLKKSDVARKIGITTERYAGMEQPDAQLADSQYRAVANAMGIDIRQIRPAIKALSDDIPNRPSALPTHPRMRQGDTPLTM